MHIHIKCERLIVQLILFIRNIGRVLLLFQAHNNIMLCIIVVLSEYISVLFVCPTISDAWADVYNYFLWKYSVGQVSMISNLWYVICTLPVTNESPDTKVNPQCTELLHVGIPTSVFTSCSKKCTMQCISQQPMMLETCFHLSTIVHVSDESLFSTRMYLHWKSAL